MGTWNNNAEVADRFGVAAKRFCSIVDSASHMDRGEFVSKIYRVPPKLIDQAIEMPDVEGSDKDQRQSAPRVRHEEWEQLYNSLKAKLGDWDLYHQVFDPTHENEAVVGTLADDIADIFGDLKEGLVFIEAAKRSPEEAIWTWRLLFYSHWGKHAMDALLAIHFQLQNNAP